MYRVAVLCTDSIALITETLLEQYSKLLRTNVWYRDVVTLTGTLFKPAATLDQQLDLAYPSFY